MAENFASLGRPSQIHRFTTSATLNEATRVDLPIWTRQIVVTPAGGDVRVAYQGTDGAALNTHYVNVQDGASKPFQVSEGRADHPSTPQIFIAPEGAAAVTVAVEARSFI